MVKNLKKIFTIATIVFGGLVYEAHASASWWFFGGNAEKIAQENRDKNPSPFLKKTSCDHCRSTTTLCEGKEPSKIEEKKAEIKWCSQYCGALAYPKEPLSSKLFKAASIVDKVVADCLLSKLAGKHDIKPKINIMNLDVNNLQELKGHLGSLVEQKQISQEETVIFLDGDTLWHPSHTLYGEKFNYIGISNLKEIFPEFNQYLQELGYGDKVLMNNLGSFWKNRQKKYEVLDGTLEDIKPFLKDALFARSIEPTWYEGNTHDQQLASSYEDLAFPITRLKQFEEIKTSLSVLRAPRYQGKKLSAVVIVCADNKEIEMYQKEFEKILMSEEGKIPLASSVSLILVHNKVLENTLRENLKEELQRFWTLMNPNVGPAVPTNNPSSQQNQQPNP